MDQLCQGACFSIGDIHKNLPSGTIIIGFRLGVNVPLSEETFKMGFKEKSASQGSIQKQDKAFDNLSFSRVGLTKALMLVFWKEMLNARFPFDFGLALILIFISLDFVLF